MGAWVKLGVIRYTLLIKISALSGTAKSFFVLEHGGQKGLKEEKAGVQNLVTLYLFINLVC